MAAEHLRALGQRIREQREAKGLTQEEVARKMPGQVSGTRISKWERGENRPHDDSLAELAKALDTTVAALLMPEPDKSVTPDLSLAGEESQLDRIERELGELRGQRDGFLRLLAEQTKLLELIGNLVGNDALAARADEAVKASIERTRGDLAKLLARASEQATPGR